MTRPDEASEAQARFVRAVYALAVDTASLQERVGAAWLELMPLTRADLPVPLHEVFGVVEAEALAAPEDPATLTDDVARAAAERIVRLAVALWASPAPDAP